MEGFIINNSGRSVHIFKRKFPVRHKMYLADIWPVYERRVKAALDKSVVSEADFVSWLEQKGLMKNGFEYVSAETAVIAGEVVEASSAEVDEQGISADGRLASPPVADSPDKVLDKLTYNDIAALRVADRPKEVVGRITNTNKLRRAYTLVRKSGRKAFLEKVLRDRIQVLEQYR